jgi:hypothetical protein
MLFALLTLTASRVDAYTLGKEMSELMRFQHQSGGFYDSGREANSRDTLHALGCAAVYGAFPYFDVRQCFRWIQTLRNRDGGAGHTPGSKSSILATYCFYHLCAITNPDEIEGARIIEFLKSYYDSPTGLFRESLDDPPSIEATYYAYELLSRFRDADLGWINTFAIRTCISDHLVDDHFEFEGVTALNAQLWAGSIAKFISLTVPYHRIGEFVVASVQAAIREGRLDAEDAAAAARILFLFGDEPIPAGLVPALKTNGSLSDLFHATVVLGATGEIAKFFDVQIGADLSGGQRLDLDAEGRARLDLAADRHDFVAAALARLARDLERQRNGNADRLP